MNSSCKRSKLKPLVICLPQRRLTVVCCKPSRRIRRRFGAWAPCCPVMRAALQLLRLGRLREAASPAKKALELDPANLDALRLSALLSGAVGEYGGATAAYERILDLAPGDREADLSLRILRGEGLGAGEDFVGIPVAPHTRLRRFLNPEEREQVLGFALSHLDALTASGVVDDKPNVIDHDVRSSHVLFNLDALNSWIVPKVLGVADKVMNRVGLPAFKPGNVELQLTLHRDGDFYKVHADRSYDDQPDPDRPTSTRVLTFVYYFSRLPQRFSGGELKLYRAAVGGRGYDPAAGVLLAPEDNSIVFFPSVLFHEVRPVRLESEDPGDGRFTLNGWIHESPS